MTEAAIRKLWCEGIVSLQLEPSARLVEGGLLLLSELQRWNKSYNLTAIRDPLQMVTHHLLDSLAVVSLMPGGSLADVGTGPGFPGLVLALHEPERPWVLVDANIKKVKFLRHMVHLLKLPEVRVVHGRVQDVHDSVDAVISRAFASLADMVAWCRHLPASGTLLAMKGRYPKDELQALPDDVKVISVQPVRVPGLTAERHLVNLWCPKLNVDDPAE
jgi:16S rRNA (guanine527-N7)-methyltransferase